MKLKFPAHIKRFANKLAHHGIVVYVVGGWIRDMILGLEPKDIDLVLVGASMAEAIEIIGTFAEFEELPSMDAPVIHVILGGKRIDVAIARREQLREGVALEDATWGDFVYDTGSRENPVTIEEDLKRRHFSCGAIAVNVLTGDTIDPHDGGIHIRNRLLMPVSEMFPLSPERPLIGAQFASRFSMTPTPAFARLAGPMFERRHLIPESQVAKHMNLMLLGERPDLGIITLAAIGWMDFLPEFKAIVNMPQDPMWHPEGPVDVHTLLGFPIIAQFTKGSTDREKLVVRMAWFGHDLGKATTTEIGEDGRIRSHGHAEAGVPIVRSLMERMGFPRFPEIRSTDVKAVENLVRCHMDQVSATPRSVRRLAARLAPATIEQWAMVCKTDIMSRLADEEEIQPGLDEIDEIVKIASELNVVDDSPKPIITGKHLLERGFVTGVALGQVKQQIFEAQLDGEFDDLESGLDFLDSFLEMNRGEA